MTNSVAAVLAAADLRPMGVVRWGAAVPSYKWGIYVVSVQTDPESTDGAIPNCPISLEACARFIAARPKQTLDGKPPSVDALAQRVSGSWLFDETIVYIGRARQPLRSRVSSYYSTRLGATSPHAGGFFVKLLRITSKLYVHFAETETPVEHERVMHGAFCAAVSSEARAALYDTGCPVPFANLQWEGLRVRKKNHGILWRQGPFVRDG